MDSIDYLRQFRVGEYAVFDFAVSFLGMFLLSPVLSTFFQKFGVHVPRRSWVIWTLPISIIAHLGVGRVTPFTQNFFDPSGHDLLKIVVVMCFLVGFRGVGSQTSK